MRSKSTTRTTTEKDSPVSEVLKRCADRCPTHPGELLREIVLPALGLSKVAVAKALGISRMTLHDILAERQPVTPAMAVRFAAVFGTTAKSWLAMQSAYDLWHASREVDTSGLERLTAA